MPDVLEWPDGSLAGYTGLGFEVDHPKRLAEIVVEGQGCIYQVWSHLGDDHLVRLIGSLRFVEGLQADPVTLIYEDEDPVVTHGGEAPWAADPVRTSQVPELLIREWAESGVEAPLVTIMDLGAQLEGARIRTANLDQWGVAWDLRSGPGHDGLNQPCADCGRGAVLLGGGALPSRLELGPSLGIPRYAFRIEWDDGSYAVYEWQSKGWRLPRDRVLILDPVSGEKVERRLEAYVVIPEREVFVSIATHYGERHLLHLINNLRFVEDT